MFICSRLSMEQGRPMPLTIADWASRKLTRVCRSSLSAESQAAANAVDQLEWVKVYIAFLLDPTVDIRADETMHILGTSPVITD